MASDIDKTSFALKVCALTVTRFRAEDWSIYEWKLMYNTYFQRDPRILLCQDFSSFCKRLRSNQKKNECFRCFDDGVL